MMSGRIVQGHYRYGSPDKRKKYLTRLKLELKAYNKTGNFEHLINIANYCWLESMGPENKNFHHKHVDSVTRGRGLE